MRRKLPILYGPVLWACCSIMAFAAELDPEALLRGCVAEKDDAVRLACYDRAVRELVIQPSAAVAADPAPKPAIQEKFGARGGELARKQAREEEKVQVKEVTARLTNLMQRRSGERVFTLDNGQVWAEKRRASYLPVKEGDTVTITAGALGSFRLNESSGRSTQVQRVQ